MRHQTFTSLAALNTAMQQQLVFHNSKPIKIHPTAAAGFEQQERAVLKYHQNALCQKVVWLTIQRNYHVQLSEAITITAFLTGM